MAGRVGRPRKPRTYEEAMERILEVAWGSAPEAMKIIAEAAKDGDIAAAYYIINRTLGRPREAEKSKVDEDYAGVLGELRRIRTGDDGPEPDGADIEGTTLPMELVELQALAGAVGSSHEPEEEEDGSGGRESGEEL